MTRMKITILTLFPEMFAGPFDHSMIKRAVAKKQVEINFVNIRDFGIGQHRVVDDKPYGGGHGMILRVDVLEKAIENTKDPKLSKREQKTVLLDPHGKPFNHKRAESFSLLSHLILICGHYEGVDKRIEKFIDEEVSIGDFIVTGGEIPAMLITDAVVRLVKGVLKEGVTEKESFSAQLLEYPQYTKPPKYKNLTVPPILTSGNHGKIKEWREKAALKHTKNLRPDLLNRLPRKG